MEHNWKYVTPGTFVFICEMCGRMIESYSIVTDNWDNETTYFKCYDGHVFSDDPYK